MARNIEIKCRCNDLVAISARAAALGAEPRGVLVQRDTFFHATNARLKLRELGDGRAELISYRRPDTAEARASDYRRCEVPRELRGVLDDALGIAGVVEKRRQLWIWQRTRIHLDEVVGLGSFVELETVLGEQSEDDARAELAHVAAELGLDRFPLLPMPYVELLRSAEHA
jgi:predicted adenylyl cyclase CyaB